MTKIQIDNEVTEATSAEIAEIAEAQSSAIDVDAITAQDRANRKIAYDKFIELGLSSDVATTISGWVENPTPPKVLN